MSTGSTDSTASIREPSSTIVSATVVSSPPSVPVPPVRGTTLSPWPSANASTAATSPADPAWTTAAGNGPSKMPCTLVYFLYRSTLASRSVCGSVSTRSGPTSSRSRSAMAWPLSVWICLCIWSLSWLVEVAVAAGQRTR